MTVNNCQRHILNKRVNQDYGASRRQCYLDNIFIYRHIRVSELRYLNSWLNFPSNSTTNIVFYQLILNILNNWKHCDVVMARLSLIIYYQLPNSRVHGYLNNFYFIVRNLATMLMHRSTSLWYSKIKLKVIILRKDLEHCNRFWATPVYSYINFN